MDGPERLAAVAAALGGAALVLGNQVVLREFADVVRASYLVGMLALSFPAGVLAGVAVGCRRVAAARVAARRELDAGSAIKVGLVLVLTVGSLLMIVGLQITYTPLGALMPSPTTGALFIYRAVVVLPVLGGLLVLIAGLVVIEGWRGAVPGAVVALLAALGFAVAWQNRGASLPGYELAGASLAMPLAALMGAVAQGTLLLTVQRAREGLGIHLPRPFALGDVAVLIRASWGASLILATAGLLATVASLLVLRPGAAQGADAVVLVVVLVGLALALTEDAAARAGVGGGAVRVATAALLLVAGVVLVTVPGPALTLISPDAGLAPTAGFRLAGAILLHELALRLATDLGLLRHRRRITLEAGVLVGLAAALFAGLLWIGDLDGLLPLTIAILAARGISAPLLRL